MTKASTILRRYGIHPRKRLGQSFLEDRNIMEKIVGAADIGSNETVIEIGAGVGIMTEMIVAKAGWVIALEIDPALANILRERFAGKRNIEIVEGDVLAFDIPAAAARIGTGKVTVIGNVPYSISSQILFKVFASPQVVRSAVVMFQEEVADRIVASPGSKSYGIPSVIVSMYAQVVREINVPAHCFYPVPKVTSTVLKIVMRDRPLIDLEDHDFFRIVVKTAFAKRRKTILNNLRNGQLPGYSTDDVQHALATAGIDERRRGETLSAEEYGTLSDLLFSRKKQNKSLDKKLPC